MAGTLASLRILLGLDAGGVRAGSQTAIRELQGVQATARSTQQALGALSRIGLAAGGALFAGTAANLLELDTAVRRYSADVGATGEEAKRAQAATTELFRANTQGFDEILATMAKLRTDQGQTQVGAEALVQQYLRFARVAGTDGATAVKGFDDVLDAFNLTAADAAGIMDQLVASNQKFGGSLQGRVTDLAKLAPAIQGLGLGLQDAIALENLFATAGLDASEAQMGLNRAIAALKPGQTFDDLIRSISGIADPTLRAQAAIDLFGRGGSKFAQAFQPGITALRDFGVSGTEAAGRVNAAVAEIDGSIPKQFELFIHGLQATLSDLAGPAGPLLLAAASAAQLGLAFGGLGLRVSDLTGKIGGLRGAVTKSILLTVGIIGFEEFLSELDRLKKGIDEFNKIVADPIVTQQQQLKQLGAAYNEATNPIARFLGLQPDIEGVLKSLAANLGPVTDKTNAYKDAWRNLILELQAGNITYDEYLRKLAELDGAMSSQSEQAAHLADGMVGLAGTVGDLPPLMTELGSTVDDLGRTLAFVGQQAEILVALFPSLSQGAGAAAASFAGIGSAADLVKADIVPLETEVETLNRLLEGLPTTINIDINQFVHTIRDAQSGVGLGAGGPETAPLGVEAVGNITDALAQAEENEAEERRRRGAQAESERRRRAEQETADLARKMRDELDRAYDAMGDDAKRFFDDTHDLNLRSIDDARDRKNAELDAQKAANLAPVAEAEAALRAIQQQRQLANLQAAVANAEDPAEKLAAEQALSDFLKQSTIDQMRLNATSANEALDAEKAKNDQIAADATAAENERFAAQQRAFEKDEQALKLHLDKAAGNWESYFAEINALAKKYGVSGLVGVAPVKPNTTKPAEPPNVTASQPTGATGRQVPGTTISPVAPGFAPRQTESANVTTPRTGPEKPDQTVLNATFEDSTVALRQWTAALRDSIPVIGRDELPERPARVQESPNFAANRLMERVPEPRTPDMTAITAGLAPIEVHVHLRQTPNGDWIVESVERAMFRNHAAVTSGGIGR